MKDLANVTFITAIKIESKDRYLNAKSVLGYLNKHFKTNVFIYEMCDGETKLDFLGDLKNLNVSIIKDSESKYFHRTKFLNTLLSKVSTPIVSNYDIDVILPVDSYGLCSKMIAFGFADIVYPYPVGMSQVQIWESFDRTEFNEEFEEKLIKSSGHKNVSDAYCGHVFFASTKVYRESGGENEGFVSYGPEDRERLFRFEKLELRVGRLEDGTVYHFEHSRGGDSGGGNPHFFQNNIEFEKIKLMSAEEIKKYLPPIK
jgi:hypothetical protein